MNIDQKKLFLDFDGVLFNTAKEAFSVCTQTEMFKQIDLPDQAYEIFMQYRHLIGPAWNYYFLMQYIVSGNTDLFKEDYILTQEAKVFEIDFFNTRKKIKKENYHHWLKLNEPYEFLNSLIQYKIPQKIETFIITTKDKQTVVDLLQAYSITCFATDHIFGKETFDIYKSKKDIIQTLLSNKEEAIFIDDATQHLQPCHTIKNLHLIQPSWGYIDISASPQHLYKIDTVLQYIESFIEGK